jgi:hypothetical protein
MATFNDYPENSVPDDVDLLVVTDTSDTTDDVNGSTKNLPLSILKTYIAAGSGDLLSSNDLSDLANAGTARTNLGLGSAATTPSTDYATAAQGVLADAAAPLSAASTTRFRGYGGTEPSTDLQVGDVFFSQGEVTFGVADNVTLTYTGDDLTQVLEKNGATTVKTTTLTYTDGKLTSVADVSDGGTITTALTYTGDKLTSTTKTVS